MIDCDRCQKGVNSIAFGAQSEKQCWPKVFVLTQGMQSICVPAEEQSCLHTVTRSEK